MDIAHRAAAIVLAAMAGATCLAAELEIDSNTFGGLRARAIGPAEMSGRIAAIDAVPRDPMVIYVGAASGGVWKSRDGGVVWRPVFDEYPQSIGAIKVDPKNPDTVWVGTGESWTRNSTSVGTGVYKSTDGGDRWERMGLIDSERIARIVIHHEKTDTVYVCATGHLWDANEERGVYRTTDGGENWKRVLFVDADTGCSDLAIDPQNPNILYAGMWQFRRYPDFFNSGGPGSGLYKSTDGGDNWVELTAGLPEGDKGRIAIAVAPSRPNRLYAVVEADDTALYRSDDLGASWEELNSSFAVAGRPFYFAQVVVDPEDYDRVYKPGFTLSLSTDGGRSFSGIFSSSGINLGGVHPDHHALWIDPRNPHRLILGTDGGAYISDNRGSSFRFIRALPVSQFYEVSFDFEQPYNVYGGLQDNGTWMGPSRSADGGILNKHWKNIGFGDGSHAYRDPHDPDVVYVEFQGGQLLRYHLSTEETKWIAPLPGKDEPDFRFNWVTPLHLSPGTPGTIYYGGQYLFRSRDRGESWERISPDLTTNDPQRQRQEQSGGLSIDNSTAENNACLYTISESPKNPQVIWAGTDDGLLHITRDGGMSWTNVIDAVPGVPEGTWVSHVEASPHDESTAHVTFDGHRTGDMATYVFRTTDGGKSWQPLATDEIEGFAHVVVQDLVNPELLFVGTELGLYVTVDGGKRWARFGGGIPRAPVRDIDIHPRDHDLIVGTHGRGIYILDDLTPLRSLTQETLGARLALLPSRDAVMVLSGGAQFFTGDDEFVGENPAEAASIFFYQKKRHIFGDLKIEIFDAEGSLISRVPAGKVRGLNRADWPMRLPPPKLPPAAALARAFIGPRAPEGTYTFRLTKGKELFEGTIRLVPDPRTPHPAEDRRLQQTTAMDLYRALERLTYVVDAVLDLQEQAKQRREELDEKSKLARRLAEYSDRLEQLRAAVVSTAEGGMLSGDEKLREKLANVYSAVTGYDGRPTQSQLDRTAALGGELGDAEQRFEALTTGEGIDGLNAQLSRYELDPVAPLSREAWKAKQEESGMQSSGVNVGARVLGLRLMQGPRFPASLF